MISDKKKGVLRHRTPVCEREGSVGAEKFDAFAAMPVRVGLSSSCQTSEVVARKQNDENRSYNYAFSSSVDSGAEW